MTDLLQQISSSPFWTAIIGAVIGGLFAVLTQFLSTLWQRKSERNSERRAVNATLQAIAEELKHYRDFSLNPIDQELKTCQLVQKRDRLKAGPFVRSRIEQNYFVIFESNAAALGRINDAELRRGIVHVYTFAKDLIDRVNATLPEYERFRSILDPSDREKGLAAQNLLDIEDTIRKVVGALKCELDDLLPRIEKYLK